MKSKKTKNKTLRRSWWHCWRLSLWYFSWCLNIFTQQLCQNDFDCWQSLFITVMFLLEHSHSTTLLTRSMGRGNMIVEFFSALMLFSVWNIGIMSKNIWVDDMVYNDDDYSDCDDDWDYSLPEGSEAEELQNFETSPHWRVLIKWSGWWLNWWERLWRWEWW